MTGNLPRDISPDDARSIAPGFSSDATAALARGTQHTGVLTPPDRAAIRTILVGIMLAMFLSALEQTIVAPALPAIGRSLANLDDLSWVVTAYLLAATAATPLFGKLADIHGRRIIMLVAIAIFIAGSVACAVAPTIWVLVLGRALQGVGGGGLLPIAQTIIADILSPRERPMVQSYTAVVFLSASILGPILGGLLTDHLHWSVIFWINVPLGAIALVMTGRALRRLPRHDRPHRLDIPGVMLLVAASIGALLALDWGGTRYGWTSWQIASLATVSAVLWILFALRLLTVREPFIPLAILRDRVTGAITCAAFFSIGSIIGITIVTPLYCEMVLGASASVSGLALIGFMAGTTIGSLISGRLLVRLTHYRRVPIIGLLIAIVVLGFLALKPASLPLAGFALVLVILGAAMGQMYPTSTILMQNAVKPQQMGIATGTLNFFRLLGGAIIVAVFGAIIFGNTGGHTGVTTLTTLAGHADFAPTFGWVFIAAAAFLAVALAALALVEERPLHGPLRHANR